MEMGIAQNQTHKKKRVKTKKSPVFGGGGYLWQLTYMNINFRDTHAFFNSLF